MVLISLCRRFIVVYGRVFEEGSVLRVDWWRQWNCLITASQAQCED